MGSSGMGAKLAEYVKKNYPDSKSDLFAIFIAVSYTHLKTLYGILLDRMGLSVKNRCV